MWGVPSASTPVRKTTGTSGATPQPFSAIRRTSSGKMPFQRVQNFDFAGWDARRDQFSRECEREEPEREEREREEYSGPGQYESYSGTGSGTQSCEGESDGGSASDAASQQGNGNGKPGSRATWKGADVSVQGPGTRVKVSFFAYLLMTPSDIFFSTGFIFHTSWGQEA